MFVQCNSDKSLWAKPMFTKLGDILELSAFVLVSEFIDLTLHHIYKGSLRDCSIYGRISCLMRYLK